MRIKTAVAVALLASSALCGQALPVAKVDVNIQMLSKTAFQAKYRVRLPRGLSAASAIAENNTTVTMILSQGSILKALRDAGYPALDRGYAASVILQAQGRGVGGWLVTKLPFFQKLLDDTQNLVVSGALRVAPGIGVGIAGADAILKVFTPDILAQIQQFEQQYDVDGIPTIAQLGPGQSALVTVIFDGPPNFSTVRGHSFEIPVPVVQLSGLPQIQVK